MALIVSLLSALLSAFPLSAAAHEAILSSKGTLQVDVHVEKPRKHLPASSLLAEKKIEGAGYDLDLDQSVYDSGDTPGSTWKAEKNNKKRAQQLLQQEHERNERDRVAQEKAQREARARQFEEEKSIEGAANALMRDASIQALAVKYLTQRPEKLAGAARGIMRKEVNQPEDATQRKLPAVEVEDLDRRQWFGHHPVRQNYGLAASAQENEDHDHDNSEKVIEPDADSDDDTNTLPGDPGGFADGGAGDGAAPDRVQFDPNSGRAWKQTPPEVASDKAEGAADGANPDGSENPESDAENVDEGHSAVRTQLEGHNSQTTDSGADEASNSVGYKDTDAPSSDLDEVRKAEVYRIAKAADEASSPQGVSSADHENAGAHDSSNIASGAKGGSWVWVPSAANAGPDNAISAARDNDGPGSSPRVSESAGGQAVVADGVSQAPDAVNAAPYDASSAAGDNANAVGTISIPPDVIADAPNSADGRSSTPPSDSDGTERASLAASDKNFQEWMSSIVSEQGDGQSGGPTSSDRVPVYRPVGGRITPEVDASVGASEVQQDSSASSPSEGDKVGSSFPETGEEPPPGDASFLEVAFRKPPSSKI